MRTGNSGGSGSEGNFDKAVNGEKGLDNDTSSADSVDNALMADVLGFSIDNGSADADLKMALDLDSSRLNMDASANETGFSAEANLGNQNLATENEVSSVKFDTPETSLGKPQNQVLPDVQFSMVDSDTEDISHASETSERVTESGNLDDSDQNIDYVEKLGEHSRSAQKWVAALEDRLPSTGLESA